MIYRLRPLALMLAAACQFASIAASATELLANPGFENGAYTVTPCTGGGSTAPVVSGQLGNNWDTNNCWINAPASTVTFSQEAGRTGGTSQVVTTNSVTGDAMIASWVWLVPGQRYTSTVWMKADKPIDVVLQLRAWNTPYTSYGTAVAKVGASWTAFTFEGVAPSASAQTPGGLFILPKGAAKLSIDDASVSSVADATVGAQARPSTPIPSAYFGTHFHRVPTWPSVGKAIGGERLWDAGGIPTKNSSGVYQDNVVGANWISVYANGPSSPDWSGFDGHVNRAIQNGAELIMVLGGAIPGWASSDPTGAAKCNFYGTGTAAPPKADNDDQIWKDWVTAVATHAKGKVHYWEIWNEPYQCSAFVNNPRRLADLTAKARQILKTIDPTNVVMSSSFDLNDNTFLDNYLQAAQAAYPAGEAYGDILAVHGYPNLIGQWLDDRVAKTTPPLSAADILNMRTEPETAFDTEHLVLNTRMVLKRFGLDARAIWDTESGYMGASVASGGANDAAAVPFIARHYLLGWAAGLDRSYYYAWDQRAGQNPDTGVWYWPVAGGREAQDNSFNFATTAAGAAYAQVSKWLAGANLYSINKNVDGAGTWVMTLKRGTAASQVVWNPAWTANGATVSYTPATALSRRSDLAGAVTTVSGASTITASPVLFAAPATAISMTSSVVAVWQTWNLNVTLTANLAGGSTPTGYVQFQLDGKNLGSPVALSSGQAVLKTTDIDDAAVANHTLTATYLGDSYNPANTSTGVNVKVCTAYGSCP
jgi:hypothetical protein